MNILILDDEEHRHISLAKRLEGHNLTHTFKFNDFAKWAKKVKFDTIFLDHDLEDFSGPCTGYGGAPTEITGQDAAQLIADLPEDLRPNLVVVHSWNNAGASHMCWILSNAGVRFVRWLFSVKEPPPLAV